MSIIISKISNDQIAAVVKTPNTFPKFPLYSRTVERNVKIVTKVTSSMYEKENQRRKIVSILASQKSRKPCDFKKYFTMV